MSKQVKYVKPKDKQAGDAYGDWLSEMIQKGYTYSKDDLLNVLQCSPGFIQSLQQSVSYIHVALDYFRSNIGDDLNSRFGRAASLKADLHIEINEQATQQTVLVFYQKDEIHDFLLNGAQNFQAAYSRQTRYVPVKVAFRGDATKISKYYEYQGHIDYLRNEIKYKRQQWQALDEQKKAETDDAKKAKLTDQILDLIRQTDPLHEELDKKLAEQEDFCIAACKEHARACQEKLRTGDDVKAMPVPAFDWWKQTGFYAARRSGFSCGELMYRSVFSNGLVKICFGNRKTFFAPAPDVPEGDVILVTACAFPD